MRCGNKLNIIYIVSHDLGKELGCYGKPIATPNIDRFAGEGTLFTNAFCASPACSPSRNCAYTGLYAHNHGAMGLAHCGWSLSEDVQTVVDYFNQGGYETVHAGLQHERLSAAANRYQIELNRNDGPSFAESVVDQAIDYLKDRKAKQASGTAAEKPFYLNIGTHEVHATCWQVQHNGARPEFYGGTPEDEIYMPPYIPDTPELRQEMGSFQACIRHLDRELKRLFDAIDSLGYGDNTLVMFTTDHGISNERSKGTLYDRGVEISLMAKLKGKVSSGAAADSLISNIDIAPTLLDAAGIAVPEHMQGRSFWPLLIGEKYEPHEEIFVERNYHGEDDYDPMRAVRTERFHYIRNFKQDAKRCWLPSDQPDMHRTYRHWFTNMWPDRALQRDQEELYDIVNDPHEVNNLAQDPKYASVLQELRKKVEDWMAQTNDPLLQDVNLKKMSI